jgi:hypothetical protein
LLTAASTFTFSTPAGGGIRRGGHAAGVGVRGGKLHLLSPASFKSTTIFFDKMMHQERALVNLLMDRLPPRVPNCPHGHKHRDLIIMS